jgi:hypothetical protein
MPAWGDQTGRLFTYELQYNLKPFERWSGHARAAYQMFRYRASEASSLRYQGVDLSARLTYQAFKAVSLTVGAYQESKVGTQRGLTLSPSYRITSRLRQSLDLEMTRASGADTNGLEILWGIRYAL